MKLIWLVVMLGLVGVVVPNPNEKKQPFRVYEKRFNYFFRGEKYRIEVTAMPRSVRIVPVSTGRSESLRAVKQRLTSQGWPVQAVTTSLFHCNGPKCWPAGRNLLNGKQSVSTHNYRRWWLVMPIATRWGRARFSRNWRIIRRYPKRYNAIEMGPMLAPAFDGAGFADNWHSRRTDRFAIGFKGNLVYIVRSWKCSTWVLVHALRHMGVTQAGMTDGGRAVAASPYHLAFVKPTP